MEDRAKLEAKYATSQLKYTLEKRFLICAQHDMEMHYALMLMDRYVDEVKYTIEHNLSLSIVSHLTYNLILVLARLNDFQDDYLYVVNEYLLDERYRINDEFKADYEKSMNEIIKLIDDLENNNSFESMSFKDDDSWSRKDFICDFTIKKTSLLNLEKKLAYLNGAELLSCLRHIMNIVYRKIVQAKNGTTYVESHIFEEIYYKNYLLYAQHYWPEEGRGYRTYIEHKELLDEVTKETLLEVYRDIAKDFKTNKVGEIWQYSEDKAKMGYELIRIAINEEQWKYFFKNVFRLEEIERWIWELRHQENGGSGEDSSDDGKTFIDLKFFSDKIFNSMKAQAALRTLLEESVQKINVDAGRDWVAFYIAYHYFTNTCAREEVCRLLR